MTKILFFALALNGAALVAQNNPHRGQLMVRPVHPKERIEIERIESAKIGFITRELQLTPDEAKAFWPIYNAMEAELKHANRDPLREGIKTVRGEGGIDNLSDAQARELLAELDKVAGEREAVRRKYQKELLKVLSPQKVLKLQLAERKFKQEVMIRLRENRGTDQAAEGRGPNGNARLDISSTSSPLLLINGEESKLTLEAISPERIASIEVLQGEQALSAHGQRGANGVVFVTLHPSVK